MDVLHTDYSAYYPFGGDGVTDSCVINVLVAGKVNCPLAKLSTQYYAKAMKDM